MKILILASNPRKDLNLDDELRIVQSEIDRAAKRDQFPIVKEVGVEVGDLQRLVLQHKPEIIHFCGHGSGEEGLIFKVKGGGEQRVQASALATLFRLSKFVKCVLLNACYSEEQATAIAHHTDYVIGMSDTIQDNAAIAFSKGFYTALGNDCSIELSFEFGKNAIQLEVSESSIKRSGATAVEERKAEVIGVVETTELKEHEKPRIFIRGKEQTTSDLDQSRSSQPISDTKRDEVLLKIDASLGNVAEKPKQKLETNITSDQPRSHETHAVQQWNIDQPLKEGTKVKQYRDRVREFLGDRKLSTLETIRLERLRKDLGLSEAEASRILAEEQEPILRSQDEYEAMLIGLIEAGHYPLDAAVKAELQAVQQELGVTDEEVATIAPPILAAAEADYQARLVRERQQEYEQKLQRYEHEFTRAIAAQYPIASSTRDRLKQLQQSLGLRDKDIAQIEQPIVAPKEAEYQQRLAEERLAEEKPAEKQRQEEAAAQQLLERQQAEKALDLTLEIALTSTEMLNGAKKRIELEDGTVTVNIPSGMSSGKRIRLRGKGKLNSINQQHGDLYLLIVKGHEQAATRHKPALIPFDFKAAVVKVVGSKVNIEYRQGRAEYFVEDLGGGITLEMVTIAGGTFMMGSPNHELNRPDHEGPQHSVTVSPFCMGKFAVTQAHWQAVAALAKVKMELNPDPSRFKGAKRPVEKVSWHEAVEFCDRLSQKTGRQYRLPSEAEWEYACRARTQTPLYVGETITPDLANYNGNHTYGAGFKGVYREQTTDVGTFLPNAFGLYDMHANVWEWCLDHWHKNYQGAPANGTAWVTDGNSDQRLLRGGSWNDNPSECRSAYRLYHGSVSRSSNLGFRVVCGLA